MENLLIDTLVEDFSTGLASRDAIAALVLSGFNNFSEKGDAALLENLRLNFKPLRRDEIGTELHKRKVSRMLAGNIVKSGLLSPSLLWGMRERACLKNQRLAIKNRAQIVEETTKTLPERLVGPDRNKTETIRSIQRRLLDFDREKYGNLPFFNRILVILTFMGKVFRSQLVERIANQPSEYGNIALNVMDGLCFYLMSMKPPAGVGLGSNVSARFVDPYRVIGKLYIKQLSEKLLQSIDDRLNQLQLLGSPSHLESLEWNICKNKIIEAANLLGNIILTCPLPGREEYDIDEHVSLLSLAHKKVIFEETEQKIIYPCLQTALFFIGRLIQIRGNATSPGGIRIDRFVKILVVLAIDPEPEIRGQTLRFLQTSRFLGSAKPLIYNWARALQRSLNSSWVPVFVDLIQNKEGDKVFKVKKDANIKPLMSKGGQNLMSLIQQSTKNKGWTEGLEDEKKMGDNDFLSDNLLGLSGSKWSEDLRQIICDFCFSCQFKNPDLFLDLGLDVFLPSGFEVQKSIICNSTLSMAVRCCFRHYKNYFSSFVTHCGRLAPLIALVVRFAIRRRDGGFRFSEDEQCDLIRDLRERQILGTAEVFNERKVNGEQSLKSSRSLFEDNVRAVIEQSDNAHRYYLGRLTMPVNFVNAVFKSFGPDYSPLSSTKKNLTMLFDIVTPLLTYYPEATRILHKIVILPPEDLGRIMEALIDTKRVGKVYRSPDSIVSTLFRMTIPDGVADMDRLDEDLEGFDKGVYYSLLAVDQTLSNMDIDRRDEFWVKNIRPLVYDKVISPALVAMAGRLSPFHRRNMFILIMKQRVFDGFDNQPAFCCFLLICAQESELTRLVLDHLPAEAISRGIELTDIHTRERFREGFYQLPLVERRKIPQDVVNAIEGSFKIVTNYRPG